MRVLRISHSAVVGAWRERDRILRRRGHDIVTVGARRWDEGGTVVSLDSEPGEPAFGARTWGSHPALFVYDPRPLWRLLGERWDVLDLHEEPFALATAEILALRALFRQKAPYVLYSAQNIDKRYPIPFRWLERWALRRASAVSVCNAEAGRIVERKGFPGVADVVPLGLDIRAFVPDGDALLRQPAPGRTRVGYVGRLAAHKGVDVLIDAVAGADELELVLAGSGPEEDALRARAARSGAGGRVRFLGSTDQRELPALYRSLDVLAVPSRSTPSWLEQFGRVAVEAMACGVPVVASDSGALADVVGGAGLLVPEDDPVALRAALRSVTTAPAAVADLRAAGLVRAAECDWERVTDRYEEIYRRVLATRRDGSVARPELDLEVVVVAYGAPELLRRALEPVRDLPVTVVDNSSDAEVRAVCGRLGVRYLDPWTNDGFAAGVNVALADRLRPDGDVLLLNPDAVIRPDDIAALHRALLADPGLASVGPSQVDDDGVPSRVWWPFPSPARTWLEAVGLGRVTDRAARRGFVIGSVLLLRAEALEQVGPLDERFFLYAEETDWAYRATLLGWRHAEVTTVAASHAGAATSTDSERRESRFHAAQERYMRKHFGAVGWQIARSGQVVGATLRALLLPGERGASAGARARRYRRGPVAELDRQDARS